MCLKNCSDQRQPTLWCRVKKFCLRLFCYQRRSTRAKPSASMDQQSGALIFLFKENSENFACTSASESSSLEKNILKIYFGATYSYENDLLMPNVLEKHIQYNNTIYTVSFHLALEGWQWGKTRLAPTLRNHAQRSTTFSGVKSLIKKCFLMMCIERTTIWTHLAPRQDVLPLRFWVLL